MYGFGEDGDRTGRGPVSWRSFALAVGLHLALFGTFWGLTKWIELNQEVIIPLDMLMVVPPWAEQTDDPEPDPNPPPPEQKPEPPKPEPPPPKIEEPKPVVEAVEKVVEKKKPKEEPKEKPKEKPPEKPLNLREKAKLVKTPPKPVDLRSKAKKVEAPPTIKTYGKGTSADKPLSPEEFQKLMNQGYVIGSRNQVAKDELTRCVTLIQQAIRREWDKESFNWNPGLRAIRVELQFGPSGVIRNFRILQGSGDGEVDRTARSALSRLGSVPGLSATFLEVASTFLVSMEPVSR